MILLKRDTGSGWSPRVAYRIAGGELVSDHPIPSLEPFRLPLVAAAIPPHRSFRFAEPPASLVFRGAGLLAEGAPHMECRSGRDGLAIEFEAGSSFEIAADGSWIRILKEAAEPDHGTFLLGPILILALALRGRYCLHAAAVAFESGGIAFLGESGTGKSTLARYLAERTDLRCRRIVDDVMPLQLDPEGAWILPHFPQLKLDPSQQYPLGYPTRLPLSALYLLKPDDSAPGVACRSTGSSENFSAIAGHTLARILFDRSLSRHHFNFCSGLGTRVDFGELVFPRQIASLSKIAIQITK